MISGRIFTGEWLSVYIHRSVLLLLAVCFLVFLVGIDWIRAPDAGWYRPFVVAFAIIALSAWLQRYQEHDEH